MSASVVSPVFIGRQEEMAALTTLLDRVERGEPAFAVIGGEAGVGKTRLLGELAAPGSRSCSATASSSARRDCRSRRWSTRCAR